MGARDRATPVAAVTPISALRDGAATSLSSRVVVGAAPAPDTAVASKAAAQAPGTTHPVAIWFKSCPYVAAAAAPATILHKPAAS